MHLLLHALFSGAALQHQLTGGALSTRRPAGMTLTMRQVEPPPPLGFTWATYEDDPAVAQEENQPPEPSKPAARDLPSMDFSNSKSAASARLQALREDGARTAEWLRARAEAKPVMRQPTPSVEPQQADPLQRTIAKMLQALRFWG
jgi:hypothetical protein